MDSSSLLSSIVWLEEQNMFFPNNGSFKGTSTMSLLFMAIIQILY